MRCALRIRFLLKRAVYVCRRFRLRGARFVERRAGESRAGHAFENGCGAL
jgi:hypothetical protein